MFHLFRRPTELSSSFSVNAGVNITFGCQAFWLNGSIIQSFDSLFRLWMGESQIGQSVNASVWMTQSRNEGDNSVIFFVFLQRGGNRAEGVLFCMRETKWRDG